MFRFDLFGPPVQQISIPRLAIQVISTATHYSLLTTSSSSAAPFLPLHPPPKPDQSPPTAETSKHAGEDVRSRDRSEANEEFEMDESYDDFLADLPPDAFSSYPYPSEPSQTYSSHISTSNLFSPPLVGSPLDSVQRNSKASESSS